MGATAVVALAHRVRVTACNGSQRYVQEWTCSKATTNKAKHTEPVITTLTRSAKPMMRVEVWPDLAFFGMTRIGEDELGVMRCMALDLALTTTMRVRFNGKCTPVNSSSRVGRLKQYVSILRLGDGNVGGGGVEGSKSWRCDELAEGKWLVGISPSTAGHTQLSFVNGSETRDGGTHVNHIVNQVADAVREKVKTLTRARVKQFMNVVVVATVDKPEFESQSKHRLTREMTRWGFKPTMPAAALRWASHGEVAALAQGEAVRQDEAELRRTDGTRRQKVQVSNYEGAVLAGTARSRECSLILTEGNSAAAAAIAGVSVVGRERYGIFPLRGKLINARVDGAKLAANEEVRNIKLILGLKEGATSPRQLRYGSVIIMADQDDDGAHIKGLVMNYFMTRFPELSTAPGFIKARVRSWHPISGTGGFCNQLPRGVPPSTR